MKKKFVLGTGGAILVMAAGLAGKSNSRFLGTGIYYTAGAVCNKLVGTASPSWLLVTSAPPGATTVAVLITYFGGRQRLFITSKCHNVTYMIP